MGTLGLDFTHTHTQIMHSCDFKSLKARSHKSLHPVSVPHPPSSLLQRQLSFEFLRVLETYEQTRTYAFSAFLTHIVGALHVLLHRKLSPEVRNL